MNDLALTILIADDDDDSRNMLKILLKLWNYKVVEAKDGSEAVSLAKEMRPDLILMDVRMPQLDGFETARRIRQSEEVNGVPIIFLSACAELAFYNRAIESGGDDYLIKPLDFDLLEKTLDQYLSRQREKSVDNPSSPKNFCKPENCKKLRKKNSSLL
jgi:DNA-binding response OmpR family regulator